MSSLSVTQIFEKLDLLGYDTIEQAMSGFRSEPGVWDLEVLSLDEICMLDEWLRREYFHDL